MRTDNWWGPYHRSCIWYGWNIRHACTNVADLLRCFVNGDVSHAFLLHSFCDVPMFCPCCIATHPSESLSALHRAFCFALIRSYQRGLNGINFEDCLQNSLSLVCILGSILFLNGCGLTESALLSSRTEHKKCQHNTLFIVSFEGLIIGESQVNYQIL